MPAPVTVYICGLRKEPFRTVSEAVSRFGPTSDIRVRTSYAHVEFRERADAIECITNLTSIGESEVKCALSTSAGQPIRRRRSRNRRNHSMLRDRRSRERSPYRRYREDSPREYRRRERSESCEPRRRRRRSETPVRRRYRSVSSDYRSERRYRSVSSDYDDRRRERYRSVSPPRRHRRYREERYSSLSSYSSYDSVSPRKRRR